MWNCTHFRHPTDGQLRHVDIFFSNYYNLQSVHFQYPGEIGNNGYAKYCERGGGVNKLLYGLCEMVNSKFDGKVFPNVSAIFDGNALDCKSSVSHYPGWCQVLDSPQSPQQSYDN